MLSALCSIFVTRAKPNRPIPDRVERHRCKHLSLGRHRRPGIHGPASCTYQAKLSIPGLTVQGSAVHVHTWRWPLHSRVRPKCPKQWASCVCTAPSSTKSHPFPKHRSRGLAPMRTYTADLSRPGGGMGLHASAWNRQNGEPSRSHQARNALISFPLISVCAPVVGFRH
ncbi:hypothetical protein LZ30DRAFT_349147 [Colletotrichum cereale]|nr:hypothetical protein LZ30DRAFT_349147 [Colletotrichum cereale]